MKETFKLEINAEVGPDGESVHCETRTNVSCSESTAIGIVINLLQQNSEIKEIFYKAMLMEMTGKRFIKRKGDSDYDEKDDDDEKSSFTEDQDEADLDN